jgi:hypothetical protein
MQIDLTEQQQQQLTQARGMEHLRVFNPSTNEAFILLPVAVYERLSSILQDEFDPREAYPVVDRTMADDDAQDPYVDTYQHTRGEHRK